MKKTGSSVLSVAKATRALGHPMRIEIIRLLGNTRGAKLSVKEIQEILGLSQPETSKHLAILRTNAVLVCEKKKGHSIYSINTLYPFVATIINYLQKN